MTRTFEQAIAAVRALPTNAQDSIGRSMLDAAERHRKLNQELAEAEAQLDAGEGIPAEDVIAALKKRNGV